MSQALRKIAGNASKCDCTVLFLNQLRHKVRPCQAWRVPALPLCMALVLRFDHCASALDVCMPVV
jgi:hypothetical protein